MFGDTLHRGYPKTIVTDNGPEFTGRALDQWAARNGVRLHFIQPGKPTQNAFIESFNGTLRQECLSAEWFSDMMDARFQLREWRHEYNEHRPHSKIGRIPPAVFARGQDTGTDSPTVSTVLGDRRRREEIQKEIAQ